MRPNRNAARNTAAQSVPDIGGQAALGGNGLALLAAHGKREVVARELVDIALVGNRSPRDHDHPVRERQKLLDVLGDQEDRAACSRE